MVFNRIAKITLFLLSISAANGLNIFAQPTQTTPNNSFTIVEKKSSNPAQNNIQFAPKLAVMISAAWGADPAMHNDLTAMHRALLDRGFLPDEIFSLEGKLTRHLVLNFLKEIGEETSKWNEGEIFLYYTGHGALAGETAKDTRIGLQLTIKEQVWWGEVFDAFRLQPAVRLILLPDS